LQVRRQVGEEPQLVACAGGDGDFHRMRFGVYLIYGKFREHTTQISPK
jgi:hypothetical protein